MVITAQYLMKHLHCSETYAQKMIEWSNSDDKKLYDLFIQKRLERQNRPAIVEF